MQNAPGTPLEAVKDIGTCGAVWAAEAVYRAATRWAHPDVGGTHDQALELNRAIDVIRRELGA